MNEAFPQTMRRSPGFFASVARGVALVLVAVIVCGSSIALYGLNVVDRKTDGVMDLVVAAVRGLPDMLDALPPALADLTDHERRPEYAQQLDVVARPVDARSRRGRRRIGPIVEVTNRGDDVVSLLSMRVVLLNSRDDVLAAHHEWAATPIALDDDGWSGPLLPGSTRRLRLSSFRIVDDARAEDFSVDVELTDIRIWTGPRKPDAHAD